MLFKAKFFKRGQNNPWIPTTQKMKLIWTSTSCNQNNYKVFGKYCACMCSIFFYQWWFTVLWQWCLFSHWYIGLSVSMHACVHLFSKFFVSDNFNGNMPRNLSNLVLVFGFYFMPFSTTCDLLSRLFFSLSLSPPELCPHKTFEVLYLQISSKE